MDNNPSVKKLEAWQAVLLGHLLITIPSMTFMLGLTFIGYLLVGFNRAILVVILICSLVPAWLWWSLLVLRWRRWAHKQGVSPDELYKLALWTGLVWPKGWIFEKTEFRLKNEE